MKYNGENKPLVCMQTQSTCYKGTRKMDVKGVLWHSTGANNPNLKRYVQPSDNDPNKANLLNILGVNNNHNDWNHIERQAGLNCWIGKLANGVVTTVQTMPWDYRPWGCGSGSKGSCNNGWIQFEICEDDLTDPNYFAKAYQEACEITAYLCKMYNINPHGTVAYNGINVPTILCHQDSYKLGVGSNHGDVLHWFPKFGKSRDTVRNDVAALIAGTNTPAPTPVPSGGKETPMDQTTFNKMFAIAMTSYRGGLQDNDCGKWSEKARKFMERTKLMVGAGSINGQPNMMWGGYLTDGQAAALFYRFAELIRSGYFDSAEAAQLFEELAAMQ